MVKRLLPARIRTKDGNSEFDAKEYLRQAVELLADIDVDKLSEDGKVAYVQAMALVAIASRAKHLKELPSISSATSELMR